MRRAKKYRRRTPAVLFPVYSLATSLSSPACSLLLCFFLDVCLHHCSSPSLCFCDTTIAELSLPCVKKIHARCSAFLVRPISHSCPRKHADCNKHRCELWDHCGTIAPPVRDWLGFLRFNLFLPFRRGKATIMFLTSPVHVFCMPGGAEANATVITALYRRCAIPWAMLVSCFIPLLLPLKLSSA